MDGRTSASGPVLNHKTYVEDQRPGAPDQEGLAQTDLADQFRCDTEWEDQQSEGLKHTADAIVEARRGRLARVGRGTVSLTSTLLLSISALCH